MIKSLIDGRPLHEVLDRKGRLRASREELLEALNTDEFSAVHRFVAAEILEHIEQLEQRIARMDRYLLDALKDHGPLLDLLETIPGVDRRGAAMLLVEIGTEMSVFGSGRADRLLGGHLSRATTKAPESARVDGSGGAIPGFVDCCANLPRRRLELAVVSRPSSSP